MTTIADRYKIDNNDIARTLNHARQELGSANGEMLLDCRAVTRLDTQALRALEELAEAAEEKSVKVALRGVNVTVYKVLKLSRLTARFSFVE